MAEETKDNTEKQTQESPAINAETSPQSSNTTQAAEMPPPPPPASKLINFLKGEE